MKLKPCPFCGGEAKAEEYQEEGFSENTNFKFTRVQCKANGCRAEIANQDFKPVAEGLKLVSTRWNLRLKPKR